LIANFVLSKFERHYFNGKNVIVANQEKIGNFKNSNAKYFYKNVFE
tara:strand:- start:153 stop:290 length:138 start_codon:yes stop_codon:yes gene_type:complete